MSSSTQRAPITRFDEILGRFADVGANVLESRFVKQPKNSNTAVNPVPTAVQQPVPAVTSARVNFDQKTLLIIGGVAVLLLIVFMRR